MVEPDGVGAKETIHDAFVTGASGRVFGTAMDVRRADPIGLCIPDAKAHVEDVFAANAAKDMGVAFAVE